MIRLVPPSRSACAHGPATKSFVFRSISYVLTCRASLASWCRTAMVGRAHPCRNAMSTTRSSSSRTLNASLSCPVRSRGRHLNKPSYRCAPATRHSGSTMPICPHSAGLPIRSVRSPIALVTSSPFDESYAKTQNAPRSVARNIRCRVASGGLKSASVATRPWMGASTTARRPSGVSRWISRRVHFLCARSVVTCGKRDVVRLS